MSDKDFWFVRSNRGSGSYPVTLAGWLVVGACAADVVILGAVAVWIIVNQIGPEWLSAAVFAGGIAVVAAAFIAIAKAKTDGSITYEQYGRRMRTGL